MRSISILLLLLISSLLSTAQFRYLKGTLQGSQENPATPSTASGIAIVKYNTTTRLVEVFANYTGLTTALTATHIHTGAVGVNGPVLITLTATGGTTGTITGGATLTALQETDLLAGNMYLNVHSTTYPGGEIRAQLTTTTDLQSEFFNARIQGAQEVPPNGTAGFGSANILLDKTTDLVYVTGSFSGLTSNATASHLHNGALGTNGPIFTTLTITPSATSGTVHGSGSINATDKAAMIAGNSYLNIHSVNFGGGEIRGQVGMYSQFRYFKGTLQGSQEVPANASTAKGTGIIKYNPATRLLEVFGDYQNLSSAITATHIHSPAAAGVNASVLVTLTHTGGTSGSISGSATLNATQETELYNGLMYLNVHNATFPGGEIRAQLTATTTGETQFFKGTLSGAQQIPANASSGLGNVTVLLDKVTNEVSVTSSFSGLAANATAAHIHQGAAGVNGGVVVTLSATAATAGSITGSAVVTPAFATEMINGNTYVNVHSATFPGGELRAQLGDLTLPVKLNYFNGYKNKNQATLVWQSVQEINVTRYELEQLNTSTGSWINKNILSAKGGSVATTYSYNDVPLNFANTYVVYRLKMVDKDNRFTYSSTIRLNFKESKATLIIVNNPVKNELNYSITGLAVNTSTNVTIVDYNGRVVMQSVAPGFMNNSINVSGLSSGLYNLIINADGLRLQQSFVK